MIEFMDGFQMLPDNDMRFAVLEAAASMHTSPAFALLHMNPDLSLSYLERHAAKENITIAGEKFNAHRIGSVYWYEIDPKVKDIDPLIGYGLHIDVQRIFDNRLDEANEDIRDVLLTKNWLHAMGTIAIVNGLANPKAVEWLHRLIDKSMHATKKTTMPFPDNSYHTWDSALERVPWLFYLVHFDDILKMSAMTHGAVFSEDELEAFGFIAATMFERNNSVDAFSREWQFRELRRITTLERRDYLEEI